MISAETAGTTILFTSLAAGASILVVGTASEGIAAFEALIDPNKEYEFGNEYQKEFENAVLSIGLAAGAEKIDLVNLISFLNTTSDVTESLSYQICNSDPVPFGFEDYCKEWETKHQPRELAITSLRFDDKVMTPGEEGVLYFVLQGNRDAPPRER